MNLSLSFSFPLSKLIFRGFFVPVLKLFDFPNVKTIRLKIIS